MRWCSRRGIAPTAAVVVVMFALSLACLAAPVLYLRHAFHQAVAAADDRRERAETVIAERADELAAAVVAAGGAELPDDDFDQLAGERQTFVWQIIRDPAGDATLVLLVESRAGYRGVFAHHTVHACHELAFVPSDGDLPQWSVTAWEPCPPAQRRPEPAPTPS